MRHVSVVRVRKIAEAGQDLGIEEGIEERGVEAVHSETMELRDALEDRRRAADQAAREALVVSS